MSGSNPTLRDSVFEVAHDGTTMTVNGTMNKTLLLFTIFLVPAAWMWSQYFSMGELFNPQPYVLAGAVSSLVLVFVISFFPKTAPYLAPIFALAKGLAVGAISAMLEGRYPGIVIQATGLTFTTMFVMLTLYKTGLIKVTEGFKRAIMLATVSLLVFYLAVFALSFFNVAPPGFLFEGSKIGIAFSVIVVGLAAFNLLIDFDFIDQASQSGAPKYLEWYAAFGLMVTLVWLYMEVLRLLAKTRD